MMADFTVTYEILGDKHQVNMAVQASASTENNLTFFKGFQLQFPEEVPTLRIFSYQKVLYCMIYIK